MLKLSIYPTENMPFVAYPQEATYKNNALRDSIQSQILQQEWKTKIAPLL